MMVYSQKVLFLVHQTVNVYHRKNSRKPLDTRKSHVSSWSFQLEGVLRDVSQEEFYTRVCRWVVLGALDGYNGNLFIYMKHCIVCKVL